MNAKEQANGKQSAAARQSGDQELEVVVFSASATEGAGRPATEVLERPRRRRFDAAYKLRILTEADASPGGVGALLRREGLYSSHLVTWRKQRVDGALAGLTPRKRGRKGKSRSEEMVALERENHRLRKLVHRAETLIEIQRKMADLLGITLDTGEIEQ